MSAASEFADARIARPPIKFVGGKTKLLPEIRKHVPPTFRTYHEPFVGGGALFFDLLPQYAVLSDANRRLVRMYRGIRDDLPKLVARLAHYPNTAKFFAFMRRKMLDGCSDEEIAAWFIYLNKTAFNGLYRVNARNEFNVPFGHYANPTICDQANLYACSRALQGVTIAHESFVGVLQRAQKGDFVYFDPPYLPASKTSQYVGYTRDGFGLSDHIVLRDVARILATRGVHVLLSNADVPAAHAIYENGFRIHDVTAPRSINAKGDGRGHVGEILIVPEPHLRAL